MSGEGRGEVNAIQQRLTAANVQVLSTIKAMESAHEIEETWRNMLEVAMRIRNMENTKKNVPFAREHLLSSSREEARSMEALLIEAEASWVIIDIDISRRW